MFSQCSLAVGVSMNITTSIGLIAILTCLAAVIWICRREVRQRWRTLAEEGLIVAADTVDVSKIERVITIDLGFGEETWLLSSPELDVDRTTRIVRDAVVLQRGSPIPGPLAARQEVVGVRF